MKSLKTESHSGVDVIVLAIADHQGFFRGDPESGKPCLQKPEDVGVRFAEPIFKRPEDQTAVEDGGIETLGLKRLSELAQRIGLCV